MYFTNFSVKENAAGVPLGLTEDSDHVNAGEHSYVMRPAKPVSASPHFNPQTKCDSLSVGAALHLALSKWRIGGIVLGQFNPGAGSTSPQTLVEPELRKF